MFSQAGSEKIDIPGLKLLHQGKVRDVFEVDSDRLLLVATDRISAFDVIFPTPIPNKGIILTQMSAFWFRKLRGISDDHFISADIREMGIELPNEMSGRSMLCKRTKVFPVECVVRAYLEGSGWKEYRESGSVCGNRLPTGMKQCEKLPEPIFTPATKASHGHDENIGLDTFFSIVGNEIGEELRRRSLDLFSTASEYALGRGIIIADTKFEFGMDPDGNILLIDEVLTPDSSRFWSASAYEPGHSQPSFDKQFLREYLETLEWDKTPPAPELPPNIVDATAERYRDAYRILTGRPFEP